MAPPGLDQIKAIFVQAVEKSGPEREAFLHQTCGNDAELLTEVQAFLAAANNAGGFLSSSSAVLPSGALGAPNKLFEGPGSIIGQYKLLELLGEGGFGSVFMAEQELPVRRKVALKIIKLGMDTRQVIARFEAERQALAMMDHPNIAKVLEAGATETGRPYFVMELVRGVRITEYCDDQKLTPHQRIELFIQVCNAVQHAHQKGIIHRDLKPSNILVTMHDDRAVPKVIDFGIAKATNQRLTEKTLFTDYHQFIGTPAYMSPEQAQMSELDVDTRSDIYSLGVLLYELLTGTTPFDAKQLLSQPYSDIQRIIREVEPPRPSTRLSALAEKTLSMMADQRHCDPRHLSRMLHGDLDWIVMKCLEKDRTRRYETAYGLAQDINRHLNNEPISARPPSTAYRLGKLIRRNKLIWFAGASIAVAGIVGSGVSIWMLFQERQAHLQALAAEKLQSQLRVEAEANEQKMKEEAAKSRHISKFLKDMLTGLTPSIAQGRDTTLLREFLDKTSQRIGTELKDQPDVEADLRLTMGTVYQELGSLRQAEEMFRQTLLLRQHFEGNQDDRAGTYEDLADVLRAEAKYSDAEVASRQALALDVSLHGNDSLSVARVLATLAISVGEQDRYPEAEAMDRESLRIEQKVLGIDDPSDAMTLNSLGQTLKDEDKLVEAEQVHRQALTIQRKVLGPQDPEVAVTLDNLGGVYKSEGKLPDADEMFREGLAIRRKLPADKQPDVAMSLDNLGQLLRDEGKFAESETLFTEAFTIRRRILGDDHSYTGGSLGNLISVLIAEGKINAAEQLFARIMVPRVDGRPVSKEFLRERGTFYACLGRFDEATSDLANAVTLSPEEIYIQMQLAAARLASGDRAGYSKERLAILEHFSDTGDQENTDWIVYTCMLTPVTEREMQANRLLLDRSEILDAKTRPSSIHPSQLAVALNHLVDGLSDYRQRHFMAAIVSAHRALADDRLDPPEESAAHSILAMSLFELNELADARVEWTKADGIVQTKFPILDSGYRYWHFHNPLIARILLSESDKLLNEKPVDVKGFPTTAESRQ